MKKLLSIMCFCLLSLYVICASADEIKAHGYNDTVIIISVVDGNCNAVLFKTNEPKKSVTCEEAKQIIKTFPKEREKDEKAPAN